jgi:hypothetical protein
MAAGDPYPIQPSGKISRFFFPRPFVPCSPDLHHGHPLDLMLAALSPPLWVESILCGLEPKDPQAPRPVAALLQGDREAATRCGEGARTRVWRLGASSTCSRNAWRGKGAGGSAWMTSGCVGGSVRTMRKKRQWRTAPHSDIGATPAARMSKCGRHSERHTCTTRMVLR